MTSTRESKGESPLEILEPKLKYRIVLMSRENIMCTSLKELAGISRFDFLKSSSIDLTVSLDFQRVCREWIVS